MTVKSFSLEYDAVNNKNVFTNGDTVNGRIILQVSKDSKIRALVLFAMGEAHAHWHMDEETVSRDEEYYNIKHYILQESSEGGEALRVTLRVNNLSSRILRPRFVLCSELIVDHQTYLLKEPHKILMERCNLVKPHRMETVTKVFNIPDNLTPSNLNCSLVELKYWMKVYLDTPFAKSPKVKLPIVLLPSFDAPRMERWPASAAAALETFESRFQTQRMVQRASPLPEEPPPAYEACVVDPTGPPAYFC